jgi:outer membrane protein assembly factor BamA
VWLKPFGPALRVRGWLAVWDAALQLEDEPARQLRLSDARPALPVVERYYAGGDSSTRGLRRRCPAGRGSSCADWAADRGPAYRVVPVGGNARILSQIEWEFAITPKIGGWPWVGALFVDTGAVFDGFQRFGWNDVRFSVGISLVRLLTQFGALSLDYAYPLVMPGQDSLVQSERWKREPWYAHFPGRIHFNWGMPISL